MFRIAIVCATSLAVSFAQSPRFEVAAIHPGRIEDLDTPSGCPSDPAVLRCINVTLKRCIVGAWRILPDRVLGGPDWIDSDRFQITARPPQPANDKEMMAMLQTLLAERFKLVLHRETRRGETMILEVAEGGPKLEPATGEKHGWDNLHDHLEASSVAMSELAEVLSRNLDLPVIDRTGLSGAYNFTLRWNPRDADALGREEVFAALRREVAAQIPRQLGLTLKSRTYNVDVLVLDRAERPAVDN
jgi:uncharacterized protein (TIGR03435 family)